MATAVARARSGEGPAVVRLVVPRLSGHSFADTQAYKPSAVVSAEEEADPLPRLR
ncbi:MAG: thiamine pyrophosphate-dependent enzyme, partial [Anaerolineae bacterium]